MTSGLGPQEYVVQVVHTDGATHRWRGPYRWKDDHEARLKARELLTAQHPQFRDFRLYKKVE